MPRRDYKRCKRCRKTAAEVGTLSHTRQCSACAELELVTNIDGIHERSGPAWRRWREAMAASVGATLLDDARPDAHTPDL